MKPTHYILHAGDPDRPMVFANLSSFIIRLPMDKSWQVIVNQYHKARSKKQRNSLFGVAYKAIMEQTGLQGSKEKDRLHSDFCGDFFGWTDGPIWLRRPVRTTTTNERGEDDEITTVKASEMYEFIQRTCAEVGVDVPDPDPLWFRKTPTHRHS